MQITLLVHRCLRTKAITVRPKTDTDLLPEPPTNGASAVVFDLDCYSLDYVLKGLSLWYETGIAGWVPDASFPAQASCYRTPLTGGHRFWLFAGHATQPCVRRSAQEFLHPRQSALQRGGVQDMSSPQGDESGLADRP